MQAYSPFTDKKIVYKGFNLNIIQFNARFIDGSSTDGRKWLKKRQAASRREVGMRPPGVRRREKRD